MCIFSPFHTDQVVSSTLSEIPTCVDLDSRLVGAVLGLRDRLLTITAKGERTLQYDTNATLGITFRLGHDTWSRETGHHL